MDARCTWCHGAIETDIHVLFSCDFAKSVWFRAGSQQLVQEELSDTTFGVMFRIFDVGTLKQCVHNSMLCWSI